MPLLYNLPFSSKFSSPLNPWVRREPGAAAMLGEWLVRCHGIAREGRWIQATLLGRWGDSWHEKRLFSFFFVEIGLVLSVPLYKIDNHLVHCLFENDSVSGSRKLRLKSLPSWPVTVCLRSFLTLFGKPRLYCLCAQCEIFSRRQGTRSLA